MSIYIHGQEAPLFSQTFGNFRGVTVFFNVAVLVTTMTLSVPIVFRGIFIPFLGASSGRTLQYNLSVYENDTGVI